MPSRLLIERPSVADKIGEPRSLVALEGLVAGAVSPPNLVVDDSVVEQSSTNTESLGEGDLPGFAIVSQGWSKK